MVTLDDFCYVDVHQIDKFGKHHKWVRVHLDQLEKSRQILVEKESSHIFCTIQRFKNEEHEDGEEYVCPLYFDFDSESDLDLALQDIRKVKDYYFKGFDIEDGIEFFYTGNRGFHIEVDHTLYNAEPSSFLVKIWRLIAEGIAKKLELTTFDRSVYSRRRAWRMTNTKHGKTGLWKIKLELSELLLGIDQIKMLAKEPRGENYDADFTSQ